MQQSAERRSAAAAASTSRDDEEEAARRPSVRSGGGLRLYAVSDVHTDSEENRAWVAALDDVAYQRDAVLVAGDVSHQLHIVQVNPIRHGVEGIGCVWRGDSSPVAGGLRLSQEELVLCMRDIKEMSRAVCRLERSLLSQADQAAVP